MREYQREWAQAHRKERVQSTLRSRYKYGDAHYLYNIASKYGVTPAQWEDLLKTQGGACAICRKVPRDRLCVDHCHDTGRVRGLLCRRCNSALGLLGENADTLDAAARYLRS